MLNEFSVIKDNFLSVKLSLPFKHQSHEMVKHIQIIRRQQPTNCLSVFDQFVKLALKGLGFMQHQLIKIWVAVKLYWRLHWKGIYAKKQNNICTYLTFIMI